jgi:hypothetical protein
MRALRLLRVGLHLAVGCALSECLYPMLNARARRALRRAWAGDLLRMLGVHLDCGELRVAWHLVVAIMCLA